MKTHDLGHEYIVQYRRVYFWSAIRATFQEVPHYQSKCTNQADVDNRQYMCLDTRSFILVLSDVSS